MPKIQSNLEATKAFVPLDAKWYKAWPIKITPENLDGMDTTKPAALSLEWELTQNEDHNGRKINYDRVIVGGKNRNGDDYSLNRLLQCITALGVPWDCGACSAENTSAPVLKVTEYFCPTCDAKLASIGFDSDLWLRKVCEIDVDVKARNKNEIDPETGAKKLVAVLDGDGKPVKDNTIKRVRAISE